MFSFRLFLKHILAGALVWVIFQSLVSAEEAGEKMSDSSLRVKGIFNSILPGTEKKNSLKFKVHPHFGDLSKRDHIRTDLGFSYGLSEKMEIVAKTRFYFGHGLKDISLFDEPGLADYVVETKYHLGHFLLPNWDSAVNLSYAAPIGSPAPNVTDGLIHRGLTLSFARPLETKPNVRVFWSLITDLVSETGKPGRIEKNDLRDSSQGISGGFVVDKGNVHYTMEAGYATTSIWGKGGKDLVSIRPGILWQVPRRFTFNSESNWLIGAAVPVSYGPDGTDVGLNVKLRMNFDFNRSKKSSDNPPSTEVASVVERRHAGYRQ
jgi:hypothetical protein